MYELNSNLEFVNKQTAHCLVGIAYLVVCISHTDWPLASLIVENNQLISRRANTKEHLYV